MMDYKKLSTYFKHDSEPNANRVMLKLSKGRRDTSWRYILRDQFVVVGMEKISEQLK